MQRQWPGQQDVRGRGWLPHVVVTLVLLAGACAPAPPASQPSSAGQPAGGSSPPTSAPAAQAPTTASAPAAAPQHPSGGELKIAFPTTDAGDVRSLDPQVDGATYANTITAAMYESLVYQDPNDNSIQPGLAASWSVSQDGKEFTFKLRPDAKFHDGTPVTADAVKFTYDRAVDPQYKPGNSYPSTLLVAYDHTEVIDEHTAKIVLKQPQANFLQSVAGRSYLGVVSPTAVKKEGVPGFGDRPVGSGPYKFVEWAKGDHITVERNPDFHGGSPIFENRGAPWVDRITFRFIPEATTRLAALESGEVNAIDGVPEADQGRLEKDSRFEIIKIRKNGSPGRLDLNNQRAPTDDRQVRLALNLATNRQTIIQNVYYGVHVPAFSVLEEKMWAFNPQAKFPDYDIAKAKQVLQDDGWVPGPDGIRVKDGKRLELAGVTWAESAKVLEAVQAMWQDAGIDLKVEPLTRAGNRERMDAGNFHVGFDLPWGWTNEDPHLLFSHFNSANIPPKATSNQDLYANPEVDKLTSEAYQELDPEKRKATYMKVQEILAQDVPNVPLVSMYRNIAVKKGVHGVRPDVRGTYRYLNDVWIEPSAR